VIGRGPHLPHQRKHVWKEPRVQKHGRIDFLRFGVSRCFVKAIRQVCPAGKLLTTTGNIGADHVLRYLALKRDCEACPAKQKCCPNTPSRKVPRDLNEDARDHARALMGTPEFAKSRDERKKVEMRFAHLKTHHRFERMRLRGLSGARDEFHLAAIVQNLKTLVSQPCRPPPDAQVASVM
jgi:hypothetical protein